jgi:predicted amidophosphoribosyltransferase
MSSSLGWPVRPLLVRRDGGKALARLGRRDRTKAVRGAFEVDPGELAGRGDTSPALLVDDVVTTGATAVACSEAMAAAGIRCLGVVSFGRTDPVGN